MTQKGYRRLTRGLFLLLFLLFLLLYLLLRGDSADSLGGSGGGSGWENRTLSLGDVRVSEARSGGFLVSEFPLPSSTLPGQEDFNENVITASTSVRNEGSVAVNITPSVYGTQKSEDANANPGLCCAFYSYPGEADPAGGDWAAFLAQSGWTVVPHGEKALELYTRGDAVLTLEPGEQRRLVLFFWTDAGAVPVLTDLERDAYSVTVKLTSRAKE